MRGLYRRNGGFFPKKHSICVQKQTFFARLPFREFSCTGLLSIDLFAFLEYNYDRLNFVILL